MHAHLALHRSMFPARTAHRNGASEQFSRWCAIAAPWVIAKRPKYEFSTSMQKFGLYPGHYFRFERTA